MLLSSYEIDLFKEQWRRGVTVEQMALNFNISKNTVYNYAKQLGVYHEERPQLTQEEINYIVDVYPYQRTLKELAWLFNCPRYVITKVLEDYSIPIKTPRLQYRITPELGLRIIEYVERGLTNAQIADMLSINAASLIHWRRKNEI